jgi:hypothetical protein
MIEIRKREFSGAKAALGRGLSRLVLCGDASVWYQTSVIYRLRLGLGFHDSDDRDCVELVSIGFKLGYFSLATRVRVQRRRKRDVPLLWDF